MAKKRAKLKTKLTRNKKKSTNNKKLSNKTLSKAFFLLLISILFIILGLYFFNKEKIDNQDLTQIAKNEATAKTKEIKEYFKEKKILEELNIFDEEDNIDEELFEEATIELQKNYIQKHQEELNEKIEQKIEEIKIKKIEVNDEAKKKEKELEKQELEEQKKQEKKSLEKTEDDEKAKKLTEEKIEKAKTEETKDKKKEDKKIVLKQDSYKYDPKKRAKLAIIIDDVSTQKQKNDILNIGYPVTMAFLPPTKGHPSSAKIAQDLPFYMIHFPMQASSAFKGAEENTLNISDSYEKIEARVKQLRVWYPKAKYLNNHTGSVFTSNDLAMSRLFKALDKYGFIFVDSKTIANTYGKKYAQIYNMPYIARNVFLDNERNYKAVQKQLIESIRIAKKQGYAVAIGHPYDVTIKVLRESKHLLKDVDTIYVNKLPYL